MDVMWAELTHYHNHCWCKNTRCSRAVLWPGADTSPTPKTTPPRFSHCQLARSHGAFPPLSDPPAGLSAAISDQRGKKYHRTHRPAQELRPARLNHSVGGYSNEFWGLLALTVQISYTVIGGVSGGFTPGSKPLKYPGLLTHRHQLPVENNLNKSLD